MTSTRGYSKGDLIGAFEPFLHSLSDEFLESNCSQCFANCFDKKIPALRKCKGCTRVAYCDALCQKKNWKFHKFECNLMKKALQLNPVRPTIPTHSVLFLYKLYSFSQTERGKLASDHITGVDRSYDVLMTNMVEIRKDTIQMSQYMDAVYQLQYFISIAKSSIDGIEDSSQVITPSNNEHTNKKEELNVELLLQAYGKMVTNSYSILDADFNVVGSGIYLGPSLLDHSCDYNTVGVFNGISLKLRTVRTIKPNEKLTICYIDNMANTKDRLTQLQATYFFVCQCSLCNNQSRDKEMNSLLMDGRDVDVTEDSHCQQTTLNTDLMSLNLKFTSLEVRNVHTTLLLKRWQGILGVRNIALFHFLSSHYETCVMMERWEEALKYGENITDIYDYYVTNPLPNHAHHLVKLAKIQLLLHQNLKALEYLDKAKPLIETLFDKHDIFSQQFHKVYSQTFSELSIQ